LSSENTHRMNRIKYSLLVCLLFVIQSGKAQLSNHITRIDPQFWWNNLVNRELQLCVYGPKIAEWQCSISEPSIKIQSIEKVENLNYLFVNLNLQSFKGNELLLTFKKGAEKFIQRYEFKLLQKNIDHVNAGDFVYLVFPDRFSNGDASNDVVAGLREDKVYRDSLGARHGGDIQGIINHLDYIQELGVTTLWLNPTLINDQPAYSYHGYALTDHYLTDPRFGSNELYKKLGDELKKRNMKLVMDMVSNHIGSKHWMMLDMPEKSFVNQWNEFTRTNYRASTQFDPYASEVDKKQMVDGWFDMHMPDVNERNPRVAKYLMQSYLWWINYAGIDGFRIDTYSYNDYDFMDKCMAYIQKEYPGFWSSGEVWEQGGVLNMAYFTEKNNYKKSPASSHLSGAIDFQLYWAILDALNNEPEWDKGLAKIYYILTHDGLYNQPLNNLTFLDNHDLNRFYTLIGEDMNKFKMGIAMLMTLRGIPSIYYGTELAQNNVIPRTNDGQIRLDFEGGWPSDKVNKFNQDGRTSKENEAFDFIRKIANWRKGNKVFSKGKTMQYTPVGSTYIYFRYTEDACVMVAVNHGKKEVTLEGDRYKERLNGYSSGIDKMTDMHIGNLQYINLAPNSIMVIELRK